MTLEFLLLLLSLLGWSACVEYSEFKTEPSFRGILVRVTFDDGRDQLAPGFFFLGPFNPLVGPPESSFGPQIFDNNGDLVWYGNATASNRGMNFHVCDVAGSRGNHVCFHDSYPDFSAYAVGTIRVLNASYIQTIPDYGAAGNLRGPDLHEVNTPGTDNGTSYLSTVYEVANVDLTPYVGLEDGYALNGCFQEVNSTTRDVNFQWCALDYVPLWETEVYPHGSGNYSTEIAGDGTLGLPWDFFHLNSIDKDAHGDYLISARHLNTLFKIAGNTPTEGVAPGDILWRLGGNISDFALRDFNFSREHMARFYSSTAETTTLTYFDNAFDGFLATAEYSAGHMVELNHTDKTARLLQDYPSPVREISLSQGSMHTQPNGNVVMGWGNRPFYSEFALDGRLLLDACFTDGTEMESFRVYKDAWVGHPITHPKVLSYSLTCAGTAPTMIYISWNGATEVTDWLVHPGSSTNKGPWGTPSKLPKAGFETIIQLSDSYTGWVYVEALDRDGNVLPYGKTAPVQTFVPNAQLEGMGICDTFGCNHSQYFEYDAVEWSRAPNCVPWRKIARNSAGALVAVFVAVELLMFAVEWAMRGIVEFALELELED
ncbi:MAG: hypothetical protein M1828_004319 [Chrysothrix sp. TS-e1954]|nr:MAG: hypothetical protein M1828_004319 [Chrysothrix sp. TS-e1954]